jgi:hypothetical protein
MGEPFPGTREGRPFGTFALIWALPEEHRREIAWIELGDDATLRARGRQWSSLDPPGYALDYELDTSAGYVTERLHVSVRGGPELTLVRGESPELDGIADCDLGFSPLTNAMPVLRDRLQGGGKQFEIDAAWVSVPDLTVHRDHQIYEPKGTSYVRFCSPEADFERIIALTHAGFVLDYPGIARLVTTIVRVPLEEVGDWDSFHVAIGTVLELPGRDADAWAHSLAQCDQTPGDARYRVPPGTTLTLQLDGLPEFAARCPAQHAALIALVADVNRQRNEHGEPAVLALSGAGNLREIPVQSRRREARQCPTQTSTPKPSSAPS